MKTMIALLFGVLLAAPGFAGPSTKTETVVRALAECLDTDYVLPELGARIKEHLLERLGAGAYEGVTGDGALADHLTLELQELTGDRHLRVYADAEGPANPPASPGRRVRVSGPPRDYEKMFRADNCGFAGVDVLPGNVGYIDLRILAPLSYARDTAVESFARLADVDALVLDLRKCRGGTPEMVQFFSSYLFDEPILLVTYHRRNADPEEIWTLKEVPGKRLSDVPMFIVTGMSTASGAEELAYDLKHHGRARLVGQRTAGAGHAGDIRPFTEGFSVFLPTMRPVHPKTGTGFQGVGVTPHVEFDEEAALLKAHQLALTELRDGAGSDDDRKGYEEEIDRLERRLAKLSREGSKKPRFGAAMSPANEGLHVHDVIGGTAAERAGLRRGDVILRIGDESALELMEAGKVRDAFRKDAVELTIRRDGEVKNITVRMGRTI